MSLNRKLVLYKDFKLNCSHESYLDIIKIRTYRHALAQIRTGHHSLEIEKGRYINIPRNQMLCKVCSSNIEDEYHFVLCCNVYDDLRDMYLPKKYHSQPNLHKFNILMSTRSSDIIHSLAKYVYYAFKTFNSSKLTFWYLEMRSCWCTVCCVFKCICVVLFVMGWRPKSEINHPKSL